jgi:opacity protein-like surface antigen
MKKLLAAALLFVVFASSALAHARSHRPPKPLHKNPPHPYTKHQAAKHPKTVHPHRSS